MWLNRFGGGVVTYNTNENCVHSNTNEPQNIIQYEQTPISAPCIDEPSAPCIDEPSAPCIDEPSAPCHNKPPAPCIDEPSAPCIDEPKHDEEPRSYNPYVIAYHHDTNTFTYNDPWTQVEQAHDTCNSTNEINTIVVHHDEQQQITSPPQSTPPAGFMPEPIEYNGTSTNGVDRTESTIHKAPCPTPPSPIAAPSTPTEYEHVPEVSFPAAIGHENTHAKLKKKK